MARNNRNNRNIAPVEEIIAQDAAPVETTDQTIPEAPAEEIPEAPAPTDAPVAGPAVPKVAPRDVARSINFGRSMVPADAAPAPAGVVKTAKGTNLSKAKVYGYDNGAAGGKVPTHAIIALVPGAKDPAGVTAEQWALLQKFAGKTVTVAYDNQVASRSVRRAYRAGAIRFVGA